MSKIQIGAKYYNSMNHMAIPFEFVTNWVGSDWVKFRETVTYPSGATDTKIRWLQIQNFEKYFQTSQKTPVEMSGKCEICGNSCSDRAKTCSVKCRKKLSRKTRFEKCSER